MKKNKKSGFTLLEVVVCVVLITLLSIGFMQVVTANSGVTKRSVEYNQATYDFGAAIDMGLNKYKPDKYEVQIIQKEVQNIQLGKVINGPILKLDTYEVKYTDADRKRMGKLVYYSSK